MKAINPIGSGDSLAAGLASAILRGQRMPDAAKLGIACGAANAMTPCPVTSGQTMSPNCWNGSNWKI